MKSVKKLTAILIAALLMLSVFACGKTAAPTETKEPEVKQEEPAKTPAPPADTKEPEAKQEEPVDPSATPAKEPESKPEEPADASVTLTDMMGHEVTLAKPAERIVALTASDCEIIYALGAGSLLVGRGEWCDYPPEVFDVPSVESGGNTNIEQILALTPDVVVMSSMAQTEEQVKQLEDAGVAVVVNNAADIEGVYTSIEILGKLLGKDAEAEKIISDMKAAFEEISQHKLDGTQTVYFEVSPIQWGLWTAGKNTFMNEIAEMIGLKNCFDDLEGWAEISEEQVLERNPDFIVTITMYYGEGPTPIEEILSRPGWENVTAVKNQAILNLVNNELSRPVPRLADGARMLYDFVMEADKALKPAA